VATVCREAASDSTTAVAFDAPSVSAEAVDEFSDAARGVDSSTAHFVSVDSLGLSWLGPCNTTTHNAVTDNNMPPTAIFGASVPQNSRDASAVVDCFSGVGLSKRCSLLFERLRRPDGVEGD
jgi:hypothetical protein